VVFFAVVFGAAFLAVVVFELLCAEVLFCAEGVWLLVEVAEAVVTFVSVVVDLELTEVVEVAAVAAVVDLLVVSLTQRLLKLDFVIAHSIQKCFGQVHDQFLR